jgi:hypothetical protein
MFFNQYDASNIFFFFGGGVVSLAISIAGQVQALISVPAILLLVKMFISEDKNFFYIQ